MFSATIVSLNTKTIYIWYYIVSIYNWQFGILGDMFLRVDIKTLLSLTVTISLETQPPEYNTGKKGQIFRSRTIRVKCLRTKKSHFCCQYYDGIRYCTRYFRYWNSSNQWRIPLVSHAEFKPEVLSRQTLRNCLPDAWWWHWSLVLSQSLDNSCSCNIGKENKKNVKLSLDWHCRRNLFDSSLIDVNVLGMPQLLVDEKIIMLP